MAAAPPETIKKETWELIAPPEGSSSEPVLAITFEGEYLGTHLLSRMEQAFNTDDSHRLTDIATVRSDVLNDWGATLGL